MKLLGIVTDAVSGWSMILRHDANWRERFTISMAGLVTALCIFAFVAFVAVAVGSMSYGMPSAIGVAAAMVVLALPIAALALALLATRVMLRSEVAMLPVLVPGLYALTAFLVIEGLLAMIGGPIVLLSWLALAYLLFCLTRLATNWNLGIAVAFSVLTVVLLVAMRLALYMLSNPAGSPI